MSASKLVRRCLGAIAVSLACSAGLVAQQAGSQSDTARIRELVAEATADSEDREHALACANAAIELLRRTPDRHLEASARIARSKRLLDVGTNDEAVAEAKRAVDLTADERESVPAAEAWYHLAVVRFRLAEYDDALESAHRAQSIFEACSAASEAATVRTLIGATHRAKGDLDEALAAHFDALAVSERVDDPNGIARSLNNVGLVYWQLERLDDALDHMLRALQIYRRLEHEQNISTALANVGLILVQQDRPTDALPYLEDALDRRRASGQERALAKVLNNLSFAYQKIGDASRSLDYADRALAICRKLEDHRGIARILGSEARIHVDLGDHQLGRELARQALTVAEAIGAREEQAETELLLADSLEATGDTDEALAAFRRYHALESELTSADASERIAALERGRELERSRRELAEAEHLAGSRAETLRQQSEQQRRVVVASAVLAAFALLLLVLYRQRHRALGALRRSHGELRVASERLAESEQRYRTLFQGSVLPTVVLDVERRRIVDGNAPAQRLLGIDGPQYDLDAPSIPAWARDVLDKVLDEATSDEVAFDDGWVDPSGEPRWTEVRGSGISVDGRACKLVTLRDATSMHRDQEARTQLERLESLGVMAGGLAHDFNNALASIAGLVSLARRSTPERADATLELAERAATNAGRLTDQLLAFARGRTPSRRIHEVAGLLRESVETAAAGTELAVDLAVDDELHACKIDANQISQAIRHLVAHAVEATGGRGRLRVRASNFCGTPGAAPHEDPTGECVRIDFADDGRGIPQDLRAHVFDPYSSFGHAGNGLGLATAFAIAQSHDGALTLETDPAQGDVFSLFLPASREPEPATEEPASATVPHDGANVSILVLEDDPLVQHAYQGLLAHWGHSVTLVADGRDAVRVYGEHLAAGRRFDLLIMDLTIVGGMGGREALRLILAEDPTARAIVASGYSDDPTIVRFREAGFVAALAKPFRTNALARVISEARRGANPAILP